MIQKTIQAKTATETDHCSDSETTYAIKMQCVTYVAQVQKCGHQALCCCMHWRHTCPRICAKQSGTSNNCIFLLKHISLLL